MFKKIWKNKKIIAAFTSALALSTAFGTGVYASSTYKIKSVGRLEYDKNEDGAFGNGDVLFDAEDLKTIENEVVNGKLNIVNALNQLDKNNVIPNLSIEPTQSTFPVIANYITNSQAVSAAPSPAEILTGKQAWANGQRITGTMPNNGATGTTGLKAGSSYTIPAGYTSGGTVATASLASQTSANATAANLSKGFTAWVNGQRITGTGADNNSYYEQGKQDSQLSLKPMVQIYPKQTVNKDDSSRNTWANLSYYDLSVLDGYKNFKFGENMFASPSEDEPAQTQRQVVGLLWHPAIQNNISTSENIFLAPAYEFTGNGKYAPKFKVGDPNNEMTIISSNGNISKKTMSNDDSPHSGYWRFSGRVIYNPTNGGLYIMSFDTGTYGPIYLYGASDFQP